MAATSSSSSPRSPCQGRSLPRSCVGSAGCEDRLCRRHDGRQTGDGCGRRESHAPEPGRTRRHRLPAPVGAFPVGPDAQDCVSVPVMLTDLGRRNIVDAKDGSHLGNLGKNDAADAAAICQAACRPDIRFVPVKRLEQQGILAVHSAPRERRLSGRCRLKSWSLRATRRGSQIDEYCTWEHRRH
jgi:hypothetical protein